MTSTNDGKHVKSNQISGQKDKKYFIELYKSLDARLIAGGDLRTCTQSLCDAWRRVHSLCQHSTPSTHPHLLAWIQRHTARVILLTEWQSPKSEHLHTSLAAAIDSFIEDRHVAVGNRNGHSPPWECQLLQRAQWFKVTLSNPWGHPVLKVLLDPNGERPSYEEILEWLKEEQGVTFVSRLRQLAASKCDDFALSLASVVMNRVRADAVSVADADQVDDPKDKPATEGSEPTFESILRDEAGFTPDIWNLLTDIEFVLLHKVEGNSRCIELAKLTPLRYGQQLIDRLASRLDAFPREKKLWKNAKDVATLVAQVTVARCMVVPVCAGVAYTALYKAAHALARLAHAGRLAREVATLAAPAATARHLHTLAVAVHAQLAKCEDRKSFVCELYVRAITSGMYELEKLKLKTEEEKEARLAEQTLATWFLQLGALLASSARIQCECTLTAFSVHPSPDMYDKIKAAPNLPPVALDVHEPQTESTSDFGSWANDSRSNTNFVKTSETLKIKQTQHQANVLSTAILTEGEALGLGAELCQDIAVLLSGPRVKTLSWDMDRQLLLENCRTYMERTHGGTRALTTELKYLNLDPRCFEHLPEEQDDENDLYYGIEKGYEHLVDFEPQPEEIWQNAWETERTESAYSDHTESDHRPSTVTRRKKKVKQLSSSEDDSDPLSLVAEAKRTEKKKERPHSKERSKDKKKSKSQAKELTQKEIDRRKARSEKKKEKKEQKRKEKLERELDTKPGALSNLLGVKVANMSLIHEDKNKVKEEVNQFSNIFIDSDLNSEGNESSIVYDGQFSMDELKSPERKSPDIVKNTHVNRNNIMNVSIGTAENRPKRPPTPPPRLNINKHLQQNNTNFVQSKIAIPPSNVNEPTRLNSELNKQNTVQDVKEQVKQSITKLIQFRRQKNNAAIDTTVPVASPSGQNTPSRPILPKPTHYLPNKSSLSSLVGSKIISAPKVHLDQKQTEQLVDFKNEINNFLSNTNNQRPVIQYANKDLGVVYNKRQIKESCSRVQPVGYISKPPTSSASQTSSKLQQSKPPINLNQQQNKELNNKPQHTQEINISKRIEGHQETFQEFIKEFQQAKQADLLEMSQQQRPKQDKSESVRKHIRPANKVTPIIPNTVKSKSLLISNVKSQSTPPSMSKPEPTMSPQCAKPTQQNKIENAPNTFARRIYMHKNSPKTKRVVNPSLQNSISAEIDQRIENLTLKMKNQSKDLIISRVGHNVQAPKNQNSPRVEIQKVEKPKTAVKLEVQHPVLSNILQSTNHVQKTSPANENHSKPVPSELVKPPAPSPNRYSSLTEKDQQDLLVLLRQQSKLKPLKPEFNTNKTYNEIPSTSNTDTYNCATSSLNLHKKVEVKSNIEERVIPMFPNPTALKQPPTTKKAKPLMESKPKVTYSKTVNFDPNSIQKTALDLKKDNGYQDSSNVKQTKEGSKQDWTRVLDALRSHKTPSRGPNAIDMVLKKESYAAYSDNSLRNQRIVKSSQLLEGVKVAPNTNQQEVVNKVTNIPIKPSTNAAPVTVKPLQSDISKVQSQAIKKLNLNEVTVKYPDKRHFPYELQKADDPFISGIPNSDYDLLEELMDDDLRQEIGELLSDEECYRLPTGAIPKSSKSNSIKTTETALTKSTVHKKPKPEVDQQILTTAKDNHGIVQQKSATKNTPYNSRPSAPVTSNNKPIIISNEKIIHKIAAPVASANIIHQLPKNIVISSKRENKEIFNGNNTASTSNHQIQQLTNINSGNVIVAHQPTISNMVSVSSESLYDPFATQIQTGLYNVNQNTYMPVNNVQNINLYPATRYAPAVSSILIGSTIAVAVPSIEVPTASITVPFNTILSPSEPSAVFSPTKDMPNSTWSDQSDIQPTNVTEVLSEKPYEPIAKTLTQTIAKDPPEQFARNAIEPIVKKPTDFIPKVSIDPLITKPTVIKRAERKPKKPIEPIAKKAAVPISTRSTDHMASIPTAPVAMTLTDTIAMTPGKPIGVKSTESNARKLLEPAKPVAKIPTESMSKNPIDLTAIQSESTDPKQGDPIASKVAEAEKRETYFTTLDNKPKPEIVLQPNNASNSKLENKPTFDQSKNCERKVLSQVQEKQNTMTAEKIDPKNSRSQRLSFENTTKKEAPKDRERLMKKRLAIINRQINHSSLSPAIPLTYAPLITPKVIKLTSTDDTQTNVTADQSELNSTALNTVIAKVEKLQPMKIETAPDTPKDMKGPEEFSNENTKENNSIACRRILLRSSNRLKSTTPEVVNKPAGRKTKVRLKSTTSESLEKLGEQITVKRIVKQDIIEGINDQVNKSSPDKAPINKAVQTNAKTGLVNGDVNTDGTNNIAQNNVITPIRASKRILNKKARRTIEKETKNKIKLKKKHDIVKLAEERIESNINVNSEKTGSVANSNFDTNADFFDIEEALPPIKIPNVKVLHDNLSDALESQDSNIDEEENKISVDVKNTELPSDVIPSQQENSVIVDVKDTIKNIANDSLEVVSSSEQIPGENSSNISIPINELNGDKCEVAKTISNNNDKVITSVKKMIPEKKKTNDKFAKLVDEIENVINVLKKSTTEMLEDYKSKENNSSSFTDATVLDDEPKLISSFNTPEKHPDKITIKTKKPKVVMTEPILVPELNPKKLNNKVGQVDKEKAMNSPCKETISKHNIPDINKNNVSMDPKINNKSKCKVNVSMPTRNLAETSGFVRDEVNQIFRNTELAAGSDKNNLENSDRHTPCVTTLKNCTKTSNIESNKHTTPGDNMSSESIPQTYKDSIKIEELPVTFNDDPFKKIVRVTLPNNKVFKATIYGKTHVSFDTLFENPELKKILTSGVSDNKRYTVNIQQLHSTTDNKIIDARITAINVNSKTKTTTAVETVNLISDDEEEEEAEQNFKTEFGDYKIKPLDKESLTKHQNKFSQKCSVKLVKIDPNGTKPDVKASTVLENLYKALLNSDDTEDTSTVNEVIEIDDSSNDSNLFSNSMQSGDLALLKPVEKINQFKNLLLKDLGVNDALENSYIESSPTKIAEIPVTKVERKTRQTTKRKSENNDKIEVQYEDIINRKYFVKLVRCDDMVKNLAQVTDASEEDVISDSLDENENLPIERISEPELSRSGSFSILNDLKIFDDIPVATENESERSSPVIDIFETIAALGISCSEQDYDRSSPVMEVYDMIASINSLTVAENIETVKNNKKLNIQEQITCDTEWRMTKRLLYLQNVSKDVDNFGCIDGDQSATEDKSNIKLDESTDSYSILDFTTSSGNDTEIFPPINCGVPSLITIMSQYIADSSFIYNLKPISVIKQCELPKTTIKLKRKVTYKYKSTKSKLIKMTAISTAASEVDGKEQENISLNDVRKAIDKDVINELESAVKTSALNADFNPIATTATLFSTDGVDHHMTAIMTNKVANLENTKDRSIVAEKRDSDNITNAPEITNLPETNNITPYPIPKTEQGNTVNEVKELKTDFSKNKEIASNASLVAFQTIDILANNNTSSSRILKCDPDVTEIKVTKIETDLNKDNEVTINNEITSTAEPINIIANDNTRCPIQITDQDTSVENYIQEKTVLENTESIASYEMTGTSKAIGYSENDNPKANVLTINNKIQDHPNKSFRNDDLPANAEAERKAEIVVHEQPSLIPTPGSQVNMKVSPEELQKVFTNNSPEKSDLQSVEPTETELTKSAVFGEIDNMISVIKTKDISENIFEIINNETVSVSSRTEDSSSVPKSTKNQCDAPFCSNKEYSEIIEASLNISNDNEDNAPSTADTSLEIQSCVEIECNTSFDSNNVDFPNSTASDNDKPTETIDCKTYQCFIGSIKTPSPNMCTEESSSDIEIIEESSKESITDNPSYKTAKDIVEIDHKYICKTEVFIEEVKSDVAMPSLNKNDTMEENNEESEVISDENLLEKNTTLVYKDDSGVILKGIEYDDPIMGSYYVFPLSKSSDSSVSDILNDSTENIVMNHKIESHINNIKEAGEEDGNYVNKTEVISKIISYNKISEVSIGEYDEDIQLIIPKIKYTKVNRKRKLILNDIIINEKRIRRNSKCKCEVANETNKFRKGRNIDLPKQTVAGITKTSFAKEYKHRVEYYSSVKFSYSLPFHKEYVCVSDLVKGWPIKGCYDSPEEEIEDDGSLFNDINIPIPVQQTLAEELLTENHKSDYSNTDADETNSNMGFGERSDRVIQNLENVSVISNFSAATLSDVKQSQPLLLSVDNEDLKNGCSFNEPRNNKETIARFMTSIQQRDKVRSFFKTTMMELTSQWLKDQQDKKDCTDSDHGSPYPELSIPTYFEPPSTQFVVQVVQVGQLPVSAAAQNPMTCDPRVTQVSDASPSQCSVENSPNDGSQEIKTEYTELKTADLSMPLVDDFFSHHHSMNMDSHNRSNTSLPNENLPIATEFIKSEVKIEIEEPSQDSLQESPLGERPMGPTAELHDDIKLPEELREGLHNNVYESRIFHSMEARNTEENRYSYHLDHTAEPDVPKPEMEMTFETAGEQIISTTDQNATQNYSEEKQQNGTLEKTDQIAHAMNAAGITTSPEPETNTEERPLVNVLLQTRQGSMSTSKITATNYSKPTPITAMALQQALAQILPPPLNQTNASESHQQNDNPSVTPQVLHIVQGKNASGNQITLVDNSQQSVISTSNATPVLHIVQNKSGSTGSATNGSSTPQTNTFSGLSLVEAGLQQGGNQLLHIVNAGNQKNTNTGQLLKRVNLLTNLANVQGSNEQKMVQFVCKSADGKAIQLNAPHQRSMVLRLQPIETPPKPAENQEPSSSATHSAPKESVNAQQEIKSRSVYEENYAKFIQNSSNKLPALEKSTSLPKFNQAFGKPQFQDGTQKQNEMNGNSTHSENSESTENSINLDHISQIASPPLLIRKPNNPTSQTQPNMQQVKQTITPMNIQTMHGGVIYTRQIPVNIGGGQTINLITVPSTELIDESGQKQQSQGDIDPPIIKIVPQSQHNTEASREDNNSTNEGQNPQPQPQPVLTQMRIKLPMLSKTPAMVSGTRVVRPSFFQIQRNVIGGANQPVYQQLVLTAAPPLGQQTIRIPNARHIKVPENQASSSESQMSSSTLEQLREFDMVLEQVKERSTGQPKPHTSSNDTTDSSPSGSSAETTQVLYSIGSNQPLNVAYVNRKTAVATPSTSTYVRSPDSSGIVDSPTSSTHIQLPHTSAESTSSDTPQPKAKVGSKSKSKSKSHHHPSSSMKVNSVPPKPSNQKPLEDEQTTQRILYILAEYKEQVENSPDKDKPAPRRRTNPPTNPSGSSKRKKSGCRRPGMRDMSPIHGEDTCRTMGSEDSSCGTSQGDCTESCLETHSPQDSPRKVVRKLTFDNDSSTSTPRIQPQRNVIVADGQTITVARGTAGKPTTAVLMPANYILPVSMVKGGQQIAIVTNRGPKILTVGGGEGGTTNALLLQRLIGPAGLKPVLARPGVRHVRLPAAALQNLQAFNLATATNVQPPDSTASPAPAPTPPEMMETQPESSPWTDRESDNARPDRASSPEGSEPWNLPSSADPHDYSYEDAVRVDNLDRTVLEPIPDRYSPELEAERIFDKMFDVESKKSFIVDSHDDSPRCVYDIDASDSDDKHYQVVHKKDGSQRQHRLSHVSAAALRHKYAILEHELRLQKSLSEECEDLGVDSPSASELFPEAELLFAASPAAPDHAHEPAPHTHTPQPTILNQGPIQPDIDDQIATDQLIPRERQDLGLGLEDVGIVTVSEDGMQATIELDQEEFARSHPNTTFHSEPTDDGVVQPFTLSSLKGRQITSTIFHANRAPATVLMTAPQTTVISQATAEPADTVKYDIDNMINSLPGPHTNNINLNSVLVKDDGLTRFESILTDSRELHLSNTASAIIHSTGNATQVIRRVCYDDEKRDRFLMDEPDAIIAGDDAKMVAEDSSRDATFESMAGDVDDDNSSTERHAELFWESNSTSERSEGRRPLDFSSDSDKCCKSPSYDETNSTDSSGVGTHMRLDSVIKDARGLERSGSADGSSADDTQPLRTYQAKRLYHSLEEHADRSLSGKTRAGERSPDMEVRRRASGRGVVKRGCHCCNGSPAPPRPKKPRQRKPTMDFTNN